MVMYVVTKSVVYARLKNSLTSYKRSISVALKKDVLIKNYFQTRVVHDTI